MGLSCKANGKDVRLTEQLEYTSECIDGRVIAITNRDNTVGKVWNNKDNINPYIDECEIVKVNMFMVSRW